MTKNRYIKFAWFTLAFTLAVILWGAFVRATGSGAGCGSHWPLCNGEVVPHSPQVETIIELTHRVTSAIDGLLVIGLLVWGFRLYPKGHIVRLGAVLSFILIITEGAAGAGLVLFELVADNTSVARAVAAAIHLVNTFLLVAAITLTAFWASGGQRFRLRNQGSVGWMLWIGFIGFLLLGASGAITALGDTLYPAESLAEGIRQDFSPTANFLVQLRVWHPVIAIVLGVYLIFSGSLISEKRPSSLTKRYVNYLKIIFGLQFVGGVINLLLLAPIWMQLVHLLLADLTWIVYILLSAIALADEEVVETAVFTPQTGD